MSGGEKKVNAKVQGGEAGSEKVVDLCGGKDRTVLC